MHAPGIFLLPFPTDAGYAMDSLQRMFFRSVARLNEGDDSRAHFGFRDTSSGPPKALPPDRTHVLCFNPNAPTTEQAEALGAHVRAHDIRFAMLLDVQPTAPIVATLRKLGIPKVLSYWGAPISDPTDALRLLAKRAQLMLSGRTRVDSLIFESKAMADLAVTGRGCPRSMLDIVYLGTDPTKFSITAEKSYVHDTFGIDREKKIVLFAGHAHERKGIGTLLDAAVLLHRERGRKDVFILVCGDRSDEGARWMQRIQGTGAESIVKFAGYRTDIARIMSHADIGVIPSSGWDSFTVSSLELAASGLPVIVSRLGGLPEAVDEGKTGLVFQPGRPEALVEKIEFLLDDPEARARMGAAGRARIEQCFTLEIQADRLAEVFRRRLTTAA